MEDQARPGWLGQGVPAKLTRIGPDVWMQPTRLAAKLALAMLCWRRRDWLDRTHTQDESEVVFEKTEEKSRREMSRRPQVPPASFQAQAIPTSWLALPALLATPCGSRHLLDSLGAPGSEIKAYCIGGSGAKPLQR